MKSREAGMMLPCGCVVAILVVCLIVSVVSFYRGDEDTGIAFLLLVILNIVINGFLMVLRWTGVIKKTCPHCGEKAPYKANTCPRCFEPI